MASEIVESNDVNHAEPDNTGIVANSPVSDTECDRFWASDAAFQEEKRLQAEREAEACKHEAEARKREAEARKQVPARPKVLESLTSQRMEALEQLIERTGMYSQFLSERIVDFENRTTAEVAAGGSADAGASGARGKGAGRGRGRGRAAPKTTLGKRTRAAIAAEMAGPEEEKIIDHEKGSHGLTPTQELLPDLKTELRDYQLKGVKWLISLYQNGLNGILADQMGLGKTVQTIGLISYLRRKGINGPFMVIGPLSTLSNWINEFQRFLPSLPALLYHGTREQRSAFWNNELKHEGGGKVPENYPVIVTSYEIIMADIRFFQRMQFKYIVVDEGHRLKNMNCKLIRELKTIPTANKLLLSGTPLQNNLQELWSLLNFLMPEIFSSLEDFEGWFDFDSVIGGDKELIANEQRTKMVNKLHAILKPFVLRRIKSDVEISLPRKMEFVLYADMTAEQKNINTRLLNKTLVEDMQRIAQDQGCVTSGVSKLHNVLMQMRKVANHPDLILSEFNTDSTYPPPDVLVAQCGKMALLDRLLKRLHKEGHKVLIFSQMTRMLDIIDTYLEQSGHNVCRIDGSIPWQQRQEAINKFNTDPSSWVFLLSTRAGGLGINLTAADTVIIYDSDWNPHQDLQAMDRCHRLGQVRPVLVLRLVTAHSVEGRMLRRAADKMALERLVIKKGAFKDLEAKETQASSLSAAELLDLLKADFSMDDIPQSGTVDEKMLSKLLDRKHLEDGSTLPFPMSGVGYEVVTHSSNNCLLQGVNS